MSITAALFTPDGWLDVPGSSPADGTRVQVYAPFHGGPNQQWQITPGPVQGGPQGVQTYQIRNVNSQLVLDVAGGHRWWDGTVIQQWHDNGGLNQQWVFEPSPNPDQNYYARLASRS